MRKIISLFLALIIALGLAGCGEKIKPDSEKMQVYASFYAMYDFARTIAGDAADVHLMCPSGAEPHDYEPTAADIAKLSRADVFIYNGNGMEHWADKVASTLKDVAVVCTSNGLVDENATDPHIWLSPKKAQLQIESIYKAFVEADPDNEAIYTLNYEKQVDMIAEMQATYSGALDKMAKKTIVVGHGAYSYLCDEYGIEQITIESASGESDPSPADMAKIIDKVKNDDIKYICAEEMNSSKVVEAVTRETGAEVVELNSFEGSADDEHYIDVMHRNLATLVKVLG